MLAAREQLGLKMACGAETRTLNVYEPATIVSIEVRNVRKKCIYYVPKKTLANRRVYHVSLGVTLRTRPNAELIADAEPAKVRLPVGARAVAKSPLNDVL